MEKDDGTGSFEKFEVWALAALFVFCLPIYTRGDVGITIRYVSVFLMLLYVNYRVVPQLVQRESITKNILVTLALLVLIGIVYQLPAFVMSDPIDQDDAIRTSVYTALVIIGHVAIRRFAIYMVANSDHIRAFLIIPNRNGLMALGLWMIVSYWIFILDFPTEIRLAWTTVIPTGIILHAIAFHYFIPASLKWKYPLISYFFRVALFCIVFGSASSILLMVMTGDEEPSFTTGAVNGVVNFLFTAPALWLIYRWKLRGTEQISALQNELGRSTANLDFLRSQINPHFLFNALNTIYGLAIQEKADRTAASVEKLGDMMRFMLLENIQEQISLKRELEYLDNYITLQKLRTDSDSQLTIQVDIPEEVDPNVKIMPMLLIPFVENAFKHGISLRESSYIKISLELRNLTLYFDVSNSTHQKIDNDPEKNSNGIGLENVRQRLQHIYPNKHELLTRQTSHDFFVHLRIELD